MKACLLALILSPLFTTSALADFAKPVETKQMSVTYSLDEASLKQCFDQLLAQVVKKTAGTLTCSVKFENSILNTATFSKYTKVYTIDDIETGWSPNSLDENYDGGSAEGDANALANGFSINATLRVNLDTLEIGLVAMDPYGGEYTDRAVVAVRQLQAIAKALSERVGQSGEIEYIEKK